MSIYNPLERFSVQMIPGFREMKHPYLVAQSYPRGANPLSKSHQPLLLCDYESDGIARAHLGGIKQDKWAAIIDLEKEAHRNKLTEMARADSSYLLYVALVSDAKKVNLRNNSALTEAVWEYIRRQTNWQPGRSGTLRPNLELVFGELFVRLSYKNQVIKERLDVFEKMVFPCVTTSPSQPVSDSYRIIFQDSSLIRS